MFYLVDGKLIHGKNQRTRVLYTWDTELRTETTATRVSNSQKVSFIGSSTERTVLFCALYNTGNVLAYAVFQSMMVDDLSCYSRYMDLYYKLYNNEYTSKMVSHSVLTSKRYDDMDGLWDSVETTEIPFLSDAHQTLNIYYYMHDQMDEAGAVKAFASVLGTHTDIQLKYLHTKTEQTERPLRDQLIINRNIPSICLNMADRLYSEKILPRILTRGTSYTKPTHLFFPWYLNGANKPVRCITDFVYEGRKGVSIVELKTRWADGDLPNANLCQYYLQTLLQCYTYQLFDPGRPYTARMLYCQVPYEQSPTGFILTDHMSKLSNRVVCSLWMAIIPSMLTGYFIDHYFIAEPSSWLYHYLWMAFENEKQLAIKLDKEYIVQPTKGLSKGKIIVKVKTDANLNYLKPLVPTRKPEYIINIDDNKKVFFISL